MGCSVGPASASRDEFSCCVAHRGRSSESHLAGGRLVARLWLKPAGGVNLSPVSKSTQKKAGLRSIVLELEAAGYFLQTISDVSDRLELGSRGKDVRGGRLFSVNARLAGRLRHGRRSECTSGSLCLLGSSERPGQMQRPGGPLSSRARPAAISCPVTVVASSAFILSSAAAGASHDGE